VFKRLKASRLKVKFAKCIWAATECRVLSSVVNERGFKRDTDKVAPVQKLPVLRNVADDRSFLSAAEYYHEQITNFAAITAPLQALLKKGQQFDWTKGCQQAFEALKAQLVISECLRMPHLDRPFISTTDWSKAAVGAVLSQKQPITDLIRALLTANTSLPTPAKHSLHVRAIMPPLKANVSLLFGLLESFGISCTE
jgi:hypothetical protein